MAEEALPPVSQEVIEEVRKSLNLDERRIKEALVGIKEWMSMQPHLPEDDGEYFNKSQSKEIQINYLHLSSLLLLVSTYVSDAVEELSVEHIQEKGYSMKVFPHLWPTEYIHFRQWFIRCKNNH